MDLPVGVIVALVALGVAALAVAVALVVSDVLTRVGRAERSRVRRPH